MNDIVKRDDGWWVVDLPDGVEDCGPYEIKRYAEEDRRGMLRTTKSREWKQLNDKEEIE